MTELEYPIIPHSLYITLYIEYIHGRFRITDHIKLIFSTIRMLSKTWIELEYSTVCHLFYPIVCSY